LRESNRLKGKCSLYVRTTQEEGEGEGEGEEEDVKVSYYHHHYRREMMAGEVVIELKRSSIW
jgi:hypothetical protein